MISAPEALAAHHVLEGFSSGVATLDTWLARRARANQSAGASRTYVVTDDGVHVVAFYAIAAGALATTHAPGPLKRDMPDPIPMAILGRLAVDTRHQGRGLGGALLKDAVLRVRTAAGILGLRGILVHAVSADAARFYARYGFVPGRSDPLTLVMSLAERG